MAADTHNHGKKAQAEKLAGIRTQGLPIAIGRNTKEMGHDHNQNMGQPEAAVAILHAQMPEETVLLIRRAERVGDPWSGHWSFPGGRRDAADLNLLITALRELNEECGIRLEETNLESALRPAMAGRRAGKLMLVAPFLFRIEHTLPTVLDIREAVEAVWMPLSRVRDMAEHRLQNVPGMAAEIHFPAIELNGMPLWGFTYRVLCEWLGLATVAEDPATAGSRAAEMILDFLLSQGLTLEQNWTEQGTAKVAKVRGKIPIAGLLARFSLLRAEMPQVGFLEIKASQIHLAGPAFDEYFIYSSEEEID
jgi:8-oxo-dGTP diphosphatase